jgi:beta-alanine--pyruvate transaminase
VRYSQHAAFCRSRGSWQKGLYVRFGGDTLQLAPPFISEKADIDRLVSIVDEALKEASS